MDVAEEESEATIIDRFRVEGFTGSFTVRGDRLSLVETGQTFGAHDLIIRSFRRFEGISDPDDMSIVYAIETRDGARGTLVDAFGVYASPAVTRVLGPVRIERRRPAGARAVERPEATR
jgi:hypothetical protein